jgi:hypothetical protein
MNWTECFESARWVCVLSSPGNRTVQQSCDVIFESQTRLEEKMERNDVLKRGEEKWVERTWQRILPSIWYEKCNGNDMRNRTEENIQHYCDLTEDSVYLGMNGFSCIRTAWYLVFCSSHTMWECSDTMSLTTVEQNRLWIFHIAVILLPCVSDLSHLILSLSACCLILYCAMLPHTVLYCVLSRPALCWTAQCWLWEAFLSRLVLYHSICEKLRYDVVCFGQVTNDISLEDRISSLSQSNNIQMKIKMNIK